MLVNAGRLGAYFIALVLRQTFVVLGSVMSVDCENRLVFVLSEDANS